MLDEDIVLVSELLALESVEIESELVESELIDVSLELVSEELISVLVELSLDVSEDPIELLVLVSDESDDIEVLELL